MFLYSYFSYFFLLKEKKTFGHQCEMELLVSRLKMLLLNVHLRA